jgi:hypothetical protein
VKRALAFVITLVCAIAAFEAWAERRIAAGDPDLVGVEIYDALKRAAISSPGVERIYVGDSVARQFFSPGTEPHERVRFLTTNATISIAGDYYLLEEAFRRNPGARDIVLVSRPENLQVNLDTPGNQDYFSAFFNAPGQVKDVWHVKRDSRLASSQIVHSVLPGVMAVNNMWRQDPRALKRRVAHRERDVILVPTVVTLSDIAAYYLPRIEALAVSRGGNLRVISVPLPDTEPWTDPAGIFDAPILYLPRADFGDGVHLGPIGMKSCAGTGIAARFAARYGLVADLPVAQAPPAERCEGS